ncbi:AcrR family transcriptional regulator [Mycolicibacterium sp. BK556]|uniref:TetR/AcrR family transcriptional regulator n=1 Tax=unclassified Mycolicibacterium TaxID=2636767 RepID=UPI001048BBD1|nr:MULTISPECIES: TetR/AcrR family transcriptional regulator [unclassified Mycolicibacterium]MBB3607072.1 AcrR family transcriptional regulator [Mycolicibacterium sp. BK556]MBB3636818.1 AcrR family transcriptional regulator [Mycolicibacterium sp. BK607]
MAEPADAAVDAVPRASSRVERRRDRRKAEIVATATELLAAGGYQGMSLEEVAERTDIAKATLYHYFSSKDQLVAAVLEALTDDVDARLRAVLKAVDDRSHLEQLQALMHEQVRILTDTAPEVATVFAWPNTWPDTIELMIKNSRRRHDGLFREVVEAGLAAGEFDCPDADVALQCLHGVLNQSSLWIRLNLPARKKRQLRDAVVCAASRMFSRTAS